MSLEQKIEELIAAMHTHTETIRANTAAHLGVAKSATPAAASASAPADAAPRGRGRPRKETTPPPADDGLGDGDGDGLGDDDGLGDGSEPQYSFDDLRNLMMSLRDIGGKAANKDDCRAVLKKFSITNFNELEGQEDKFDDVAKAIKALAAKKKVTL